MGMFDTIIVDSKFNLNLTRKQQEQLDRALGDNKWDREFQTKDLECWLCKYRLDKNNRLWQENEKQSGRKWKRLYHTGQVCFYTYIDDDQHKHDIRLEYTVTFVKGTITDMHKRFDLQDNSTRITNAKMFEHNRRKHDAMRATMWWKAYNIIYKTPGRWLIDMLAKILYKSHIFVSIRCRRVLFPW